MNEIKMFGAILLLAACDTGTHLEWQPAPEREDLRACNIARAGSSSGVSYYNFMQCMHSMGYRQVVVPNGR